MAAMTEFQIFSAHIDEEIRGHVYAQAMEFSQFLDRLRDANKKDKFLLVVFDVMTKLQALKYHLSNYEALERKHVEHIKAEYTSNPDMTESAYDLLFELEAFLFQLKSTLDIAVKILGIMLPNRFKTHTFGNKGEDLIKGLNNYLNDGSARENTVNNLVAMLKEDKDSWLEQTINLRDTISHYKTFSKYKYSVKKLGGKMEVSKPLVSGLEVHEYMQIAYKNCLDFIRDFMSLSVELILPPVFQLGPVKNPHVGPPLDKYVKFGLHFSDKAKFVTQE